MLIASKYEEIWAPEVDPVIICNATDTPSAPVVALCSAQCNSREVPLMLPTHAVFTAACTSAHACCASLTILLLLCLRSLCAATHLSAS